MSVPAAGRERPGESVAGFLAAIALFASCVGLIYRPGRMIPAAIVVALIATAIGGRHERLATFALAVSAVAFVAGMTIAVATEQPLF